MRKEEKQQLIDSLAEKLNESTYFYLADIANLNVEKTGHLRRLAFKKDVKLQVVKNTLLRKAMEQSEKNLEELYDSLIGPTSVMFADAGNVPAKLIQEFRKRHKQEKPLLKAAYVEEMFFIGEDQLDRLANIKSKNELVADVIALLQSPIKTVMSQLQSGGQTITGVLKTLSEKE
ncbi:MAG: 50S ribosomal protein L10 [Bacteroidales bacterium]|nr:50S ribosomal protein L10 [Bacteroidales bacterium]